MPTTRPVPIHPAVDAALTANGHAGYWRHPVLYTNGLTYRRYVCETCGEHAMASDKPSLFSPQGPALTLRCDRTKPVGWMTATIAGVSGKNGYIFGQLHFWRVEETALYLWSDSDQKTLIKHYDTERQAMLAAFRVEVALHGEARWTTLHQNDIWVWQAMTVTWLVAPTDNGVSLDAIRNGTVTRSYHASISDAKAVAEATNRELEEK